MAVLHRNRERESPVKTGLTDSFELSESSRIPPRVPAAGSSAKPDSALPASSLRKLSEKLLSFDSWMQRMEQPVL